MDIHQLAYLIIEKSNLLNKEESFLKECHPTELELIDRIKCLSSNLEGMATFIPQPNSADAVEKYIKALEAECESLALKLEATTKKLMIDQAITYQNILDDIKKFITTYRYLISDSYKIQREKKTADNLIRFGANANAYFA